MSAPVLATRAVLAPDGLTVDGQPFPFLISAEGVTAAAYPGGPTLLHVAILVDGPVVLDGFRRG